MPLKLPEHYSRTLVVIGRFRSNGEKEKSNGVFVFENGSKAADGPLSAADVFAVLKPELRLLESGTIEVDDASYYGIKLQAPDAQGKGSSLPIDSDSFLLEWGGSDDARTDEKRAEAGGKLIDEMLHNLDIVARMSGSSFPSALLELAHRYLNVDVNKRLKDTNKLVATVIDTAFRDDPVVTGRILDLLLAFEADVPGARNALYAALLAFDLKSRNEDIAAKIEAIIGSVEQLREMLRIGPLAYDKSWEEVVGNATDLKMPWVADVSRGDDIYKLALGDIPTEIKIGSSLRDAYVVYRERAGRLHKLVRAPVLHSYVFMWLTSKYDRICEGKSRQRAEKMWRRGVIGVDEKNRKYGVTSAYTAKLMTSAEDKAMEEIKSYPATEEFAGFAKQLIPDICDVVLIENRFRRGDLLQRLEKLFVGLSGAISGPAAAALDETRKAIAAYGPVYQRLVNVLNASEAAAWNETALTKAIEETCKAAHATGIKEAVEAAKQSLKDKVDNESEEARRERIRADTLDAFVRAVSGASIKMFAKEWEANPQIADQARRLPQLYRAAGLVTGRQDVVSETPAAILTAPPERGKVSDVGKARLEKSFAAATSAPAPVRLPLPKAMGDTLPAGERMNGEVHNGADKSVGTWSASNVEGVGIVIFGEDDSDLSGAKLVLPDGAPPWLLETVDPQGQIETDLKERRAARAERAKAVEGLGELGEYARKREEMRRFYVNPGNSPMSDLARADFQRRLRTLTLGEIIAAAPDQESRLGSLTISETLKLLLDISEAIGDLDNLDLKEPKPDQVSAKALGPETDADPAAKLNLSTYFPLPNGPESDVKGPDTIDQSITFHRALADSVDDVSDFLGDLADLKAIADAADPNAKLIVINRTLAEYAEQALKAGGQMLTRDFHAATLYLTRAAKADGKAWGGFGGTFARNYVKDKDGTALLSCPMVISAVSDDLTGCPFPVAALKRIRKLKLRARPPGEKPLDPGTRESPPDGHAFSTMDRGLIVDHGAGLSVPAAMAAVAIMSNTEALGTLSPDQPDDDFEEAFEKLVKIPYVKGETIVALLRRLWLQPETNTCLPALAVSRIATLALMAGSGEGAPTDLKDLLGQAQLAQVSQVKDQIDKKALEALQKATFDTAVLPKGAGFKFLIDEKDDVALVNFSYRLFKTEPNDKPISLQVQTAGGSTIVAGIAPALCEPLHFLNV